MVSFFVQLKLTIICTLEIFKLNIKNMTEAIDDVSIFVAKHRKIKTTLTIESIPWYKRQIKPSEFMYKKAKNGMYYVRHIEWSNNIWIGPYRTIKDVNNIINSYVETSLITTLDKVINNNKIHSVYIENINNFFEA